MKFCHQAKVRAEMQATTGSCRRGFSLVELLAVITIIGVLAAVIAPVISQSRMVAKRSLSGANMRQIGVALHLYAKDNGGWLPETSEMGVKRSWIHTLSPYLDDVKEVFVCPDDPEADARRAMGVPSYVANEYLFKDDYDPFGRARDSFRNIDALKNPSRTITMFVGADHLPVSNDSDHAHARNWFHWYAVIADIQPDRFRTGKPASDRSQGTANYLFADGHIEIIAAAEVKRRIESGDNIGRPPEAR